MSKEYIELEKKIRGPKFNTFCKKILSKEINELEHKRQLYIYLIIAVVIALACVCIYLLGHSNILQEKNTELLVYLIIMYVAIVSCPIMFFSKLYKKDFKKTIIKKLFKFAGDFEYIDPKRYLEQDKRYVASLSLLKKFAKFHCDDRLKGTYKGLPIDIMDIELSSKVHTKKGTKYVITFKGVVITVPCNKKFKNKTIVKNHTNMDIDYFNNQVHLEDPEFHKYYCVTSHDQIEARYLLTTGFMNRLVELQKTGLIIDISFENGNINLAIASDAKRLKSGIILLGGCTNFDWFDINFFQKPSDFDTYRKILLDLVQMLSIIDELKLDQEIGL